MQCKWESNHEPSLKCLRRADSSGYCIFHKKDKSREENSLFTYLIMKENISDFRGFIFEDDFIIRDVIKYDYLKLNFDEAIFKKKAFFNKFEFKKSVTLNYTEFKGYITFESSTFMENLELTRTKFNKKYIANKVFEKVSFQGQAFIITSAKNLPRLEGIIFSPCTKFILRYVRYSKSNGLYGKINYRIARTQANIIGDNERIGYYYYNERNYASKIMKPRDYPRFSTYLNEKFFDLLSKYTIGYGEKPWRLIITTLIIISLFAFLYMFCGVKNSASTFISISLNDINSYSIKELIKRYIDLWYFSTVTFTTLGYGDLTVSTGIGKVLVCLEAFIGITIGSTWASIVIKRMIR